MCPSTVDAAIALGSNLGDRAAIISSAIAAMSVGADMSVIACGPVIESEPMLPTRAMSTLIGAAGGSYLNSVVLVRTALMPMQLLNQLQEIERAHGRVRTPGVRWAPRTLDLDLLLYGDLIIDAPGLRVPHRGLHERLFVLEPLAEVAPAWIVPTLGRTVADLLISVRATQAVQA